MNTFICVYRHTINPSCKKGVLQIAKEDVLVKEFCNDYFKIDNVYDWGDDPAFFMAKKEFNDLAFATWGVCRRNVRAILNPGDIVIFFCVRQELTWWDYYFIGFGTVRQTLMDRELIWNNHAYQRYQSFYNILVKDGRQYEPFGKMHDDWEKRLKAPYIFFEINESLTKFNINTPLKVAIYDSKIAPLEKGLVDTDDSVKKLHNILFRKYCNVSRSLRTNNPQIAHPHIRLNVSSSEVPELRKDLQEFC